MDRYEVRDVVCDYGVFENDELKLVLNSRRIADGIRMLCEEDQKRGGSRSCPECGFAYYSNDGDYNYCQKCGAKLEKEEIQPVRVNPLPLVYRDELKAIRERIACPQLGDVHYGRWGCLNLEKRILIARLIRTIEFLDEAVRQYTDPGEAQCTECSSSGNKFLDIIGCQQAEIAKLRENEKKYKRVYALLEDLLIIPNIDCAGKFRPIKNTSRHQVYRTVLDAQIILGMNRRNYTRTDPGEDSGL